MISIALEAVQKQINETAVNNQEVNSSIADFYIFLRRRKGYALCTDGLEKAFLSDEKLASYYGTIMNVLRLGGKDVLLNKLAEVLPKISALTSGDDISLAGIYSTKI